MARDAFIFYRDWLNALNEMPDEVQLETYKAIANYALDGNLSELSPLAKIAFSFIKPQINRDLEKYNKVVERNRANGKLGGRKPKQTKANPDNPVGFLETEANPNNLDNDNVNDNVNEKENGIEVYDATEVALSENNSDREHKDKINFDALVDFFNNTTNGVFGVVRKPLSDKRKKLIRARKRHLKSILRLKSYMNAQKEVFMK